MTVSLGANDELRVLGAIEDEAQLDDLGPTDEEMDEIKAGIGSEDGGGGHTGGDWIMNHNETTASDGE